MDSVRKALSLFYQRSDWVRFERLLDQTPARIKAVVLNNVDQESLLHRAVTDVDLPIIQLLFKHGADPHCIEDDMNLLTTLVRHCMKRGSWLEVAKLLVERVQMDPDTLLSAVDNSFYEMLEYLLSTDAVIEQRHIDHQNTSRQTCLHRAAIRGDAAFTLLLLSHGAHAKLRDQNAQTALMMAQEASAYRVEAVLRMPAKTLRSIRLLARAIVTSQESVTKLLTQASDPLKLLLSPYGPTDAPLLLRAVTLHKISALKAMLAFVPKHQGTHPFKFKVDDVVTQGPHWPPYLTGYGPEGVVTHVGLDGYASVLWNFNGNSFDSSHRVVENDHFEIVLASSEHHGVVQRAMNVACHLGHQLVVNLLLEWGGIVDTEAWVPAWISEGKTDLLRQYVTPEFLEGTRNSNLIDIETAARLGHTSTVQWGLSVKPEFLEDRNIQTRAFIAASRCGHDGTVKALLEVWPRGVDVLGQEDISPLIAAVKHSHLSTAALLLQHGADVNHEGSDGKSPLLVACERGSLEMVKLLLSHKGMLSAVDDDDNTALHYASGAGNWQLIQFLLEQGLKSQLKTRNKNLQTPLHLACEQPFIRSVSVLLEAGSLVSVVDKEGNSPLQEAVEQGHEMVVSQLLRYNAKWNDLPHSNDFEPLVQSLNSGILVAAAIETRWAIYENQVAGLKEMARSLKHEAQVVFDAVEAAHVAAQLGNVKALEVVLQAGADVQARNAQGQSPLHLACISGHPAVIKLLLDKGAKTDGVTAEGNLAWHLACSRGHTAVVKMLLSAVDINAVNQKGMSGLAFACWNGHVDVVTELLKHDVDTGGNDKPSPLLVATEHVHIPCVQALLNAKVNPLIKFEDENALHKASATSSVPLVKLLLTTSLKDHIDAHGISGMTPLMYAAGRGDEPIVITLLEHGADPSIQTIDGETAEDIAAGRGFEDLAELLRLPQRIAGIYGGLRQAMSNANLDISSQLQGLDPSVRAELLATSDSEAETLLHHAVMERDDAAVHDLLAAGAPLEQANSSGLTPLLLAIQLEDCSIVRALLAAGADPKATNSKGGTSLHMAVAAGNLDILGYVIDKVNVNVTDTHGDTPLMEAARRDDQAVVLALLEKKCVVDSTNDLGKSALDLARDKENDQTLAALLLPKQLLETNRLVLKHLQENNGDAIRRCLSSISAAEQQKILEMVRARRGRRLLLLAADQGKLHALQVFVELGANVSVVDAEGATALMLAAQGNHTAMVSFLLQHGCNPVARDEEGRTALYYACMQRACDTASALLTHSPDLINEADLQKTTPLLYAVSHGDRSMASLLLQHGADVNAENADGNALKISKSDLLPLLKVPGNLIRSFAAAEQAICSQDYAALEQVLSRLNEQEREELCMLPLDSTGGTLVHLACFGMYHTKVAHHNHSHPLLRTPIDVYWRCDGEDFVPKCPTAIFDEPMDRQLRFRCTSGCDFDFCGFCIQQQLSSNTDQPSSAVSRSTLGRNKSLKRVSNAEGVHRLVDVLCKQLPPSVMKHGDAQKRTPLWLASLFGYSAAVECLIEETRDPINMTDSNFGYTPVHVAAAADHAAVLEAFHRKKVSLEVLTKTKKSTPLLVAAKHRADGALRFLVAHGSNVNAVGQDKKNPVWLAVTTGSLPCLSALAETCVAKLDAVVDDETPLLLAINNGDVPMVDALLQYGADRSPPIEGASLLDVAKHGGQWTISVALQLPPAVSRAQFDTIWQAVDCLQPKLEYVKSLLEALSSDSSFKAIAIASGQQQNTLLHVIATRKYSDKRVRADLAALLLTYNHKPFKSRNRVGESPLWLAASRGHTYALREMMKYAPSPTAAAKLSNDQGISAAAEAARCGHYALAAELCQDIDASSGLLSQVLEQARDQTEAGRRLFHDAVLQSSTLKVNTDIAALFEQFVDEADEPDVIDELSWDLPTLSVKVAAHLPRLVKRELELEERVSSLATVTLISAYNMHHRRKLKMSGEGFELDSTSNAHDELPALRLLRNSPLGLMVQSLTADSGFSSAAIARVVEMYNVDDDTLPVTSNKLAELIDLGCAPKGLTCIKRYFPFNAQADAFYREQMQRDPFTIEGASQQDIQQRLDTFDTLGSIQDDYIFLTTKAHLFLPAEATWLRKLLKRLPQLQGLFNLDKALYVKHPSLPAPSAARGQAALLFAWSDACRKHYNTMEAAYLEENKDFVSYHGTECLELDFAFAEMALQRRPFLALEIQNQAIRRWKYQTTSLPMPADEAKIVPVFSLSQSVFETKFKRLLPKLPVERAVEMGEVFDRYQPNPGLEASNMESIAMTSMAGDSSVSGHAESQGANTAPAWVSEEVHNGVKFANMELQSKIHAMGHADKITVDCEVFVIEASKLMSDRKSLHRRARDALAKEQYQLLQARLTSKYLWINHGRAIFSIYAGMHIVILLLLMAVVQVQRLEYDNIVVGLEYVLLGLNGLDILSELFAARQGLRIYRRDYFNYLDFLRMSLSSAYLCYSLFDNRDTKVRAMLQSAAVYFTWINLVALLRPFQVTGRFIVMIFQVMVDIRLFLGLVLIFLFAFASAMIVLEDDDLPGYESLPNALFSGFEALLFNSYETFLLNVRRWEVSAAAISVFSISIFFVSVVLLNLLIAILSDSYERVQDSASLEMAYVRASYVLDQEDSIFGWLYDKLYGIARPTHFLIIKPKSLKFISKPPTDDAVSFLTMLKEHVTERAEYLFDKLRKLVSGVERLVVKVQDDVRESKQQQMQNKGEILDRVQQLHDSLRKDIDTANREVGKLKGAMGELQADLKTLLKLAREQSKNADQAGSTSSRLKAAVE